MGSIFKDRKECFSGWRNCMSKCIELTLFIQTNKKEHTKKATMGTFLAMCLVSKTQEIVLNSKTWNWDLMYNKLVSPILLRKTKLSVWKLDMEGKKSVTREQSRS